jgi:hypothetical protein
MSIEEKKRRGRPPKVIPGSIKINNSPLYTLCEVTKEPSLNINNIIQLRLFAADIARLEQLKKNNTFDEVIVAFNDNCHFKNELLRSPTGCVPPVAPPPAAPLRAAEETNRKDLIINDGVKRQVKQVMSVFAEEWPCYSPYVCWNDCHPFTTTPVGIPHMFTNNVFHCYGNFCSYNCALRYLCPDDEDDLAMLNSSTDYFVNDDLSDKRQLLELLCHIETDKPFFDSIKKAPKRLLLSIFGGTLSIEEYRANFQSHTAYHVFRSPMVPISYQMEECIDRNEGRSKSRGNSITSQKLERAYIKLLNNKTNNSAILHKLLLQS